MSRGRRVVIRSNEAVSLAGGVWRANACLGQAPAFAGSDAGAERTAVIYSLIATCKLCGIDPFVYLRDVLDR
ncbi:MAG: transposase domain-containing protein, partial [Phycisphaerales bacterium]